MVTLEQLQGSVRAALGERIRAESVEVGQLVVEVPAAGATEALTALRDRPELAFTILVDLLGVDYQGHATEGQGARYAVVYNLLSIANNARIRVRVRCPDDDFPALDSVMPVWPVANWYEREAFDLYGIVFRGHPDLRRILTDYGFVGHPFRKDFPVTGYVEMRYDPEQKRVIYQPVSIEPREVTPRIVREEHYAEGRG